MAVELAVCEVLLYLGTTDTLSCVNATLAQESDVAVELAVCEVLLGSPDLALAMLQEDERIGAALRCVLGGRCMLCCVFVV